MAGLAILVVLYLFMQLSFKSMHIPTSPFILVRGWGLLRKIVRHRWLI